MSRRKLEIHQNLLKSVISEQAGTFDKAVLECMMNSIEAGATQVDSNLVINDGKAVFTVKDDGRGIQSEDEVKRFFATFGTPHLKSENKIWAKFRMGRGQAFSFGKNVWRTNTFKMTVDIDNWGLEYEFEEGLPYVKGLEITIELYKNPLTNWQYPSMDKLVECIQRQVEFMPTPIYFNGVKISTNPEDLDWTQEDENAYYLFGVGTNLSIYNLGAFVRTKETYEFGVCGIVVSKKQLKVNFARNDIMSECEVWRDIVDVIRENKKRKVRNSYNRLTDSEKQSVIADVRDNLQGWDDVKNIALIRTSQRKMLSPYNILNLKSRWTFAKSGDRRADNLMERGQAVCIDLEMASDLRYRGAQKDFFTFLFENCLEEKVGEKEATEKLTRLSKLYVPLDELTNSMKDSYETIPQEKWTMLEKRIIRVLQRYNCWEGRTLTIGVSDTANGWTDGRSYIAIERVWLSNFGDFCYDSAIHQLFSLLTHELAHDCDTTFTHIHSPEYYENYYQIDSSSLRSPRVHALDFRRSLNRMKIDQINEKQAERQRREQKKRNKKLGLVDISTIAV